MNFCVFLSAERFFGETKREAIVEWIDKIVIVDFYAMNWYNM